MTLRKLPNVGVRAAVLWAGLAIPLGAADSAPPLPFSPGETLTYDVTWSIFPAGEVTATLKRAEGRSPESYEVVTRAQSQGFVSLLYKVENEFHSVFDPRTLCSQEIHKKVNEGWRHKDTRIVFNNARQVAVLDEVDLSKSDAPRKHAENEIPPCVTDIVTAFYYVRRQPLHVGEQVQLPINDGAKTYDVTVEVQAREQIQTPLGTRFAFRVEPKVFGGLYKRKGRMLIWFSDDGQRLPLRIKASMTLGTITGTLKSISPSPASNAASR
ncbi:MAG: DUF3108 domain-containing protein [Acidobacteriia bacterium]|nr:DUF3108 domain-containing protein [Terriglobia bacterium]